MCSHSFAGNDARNQVERKNLFRALRIAIDVEGDALPQKRHVHRLPLGFKFGGRQALEQFLKLAVMRSQPALAIQHFIETVVGLVILESYQQSPVIF